MAYLLCTSSNKKRINNHNLQMETINEFLTERNATYLDCSKLTPEQIDTICKIISGDLTYAMQDGYTMAFTGLYLEKHKDVVHPVSAEQYYKSAFDVGKIPCIGFYYHCQKQYDLAIQYLTKCDKTIYVARAIGHCYHWQDKHALSLKYYKMVLEYDENDTNALLFIGHAHAQLKNYEDAEYYLVRCKNCDENYFRANNGYFWLADAYENQKRYKLAISCYTKHTDKPESDESKGKAYNGIAICYERCNEFELAEEYYLKAIEHKNTSAHFNLGDLYRNQMRCRLAKQQYELALKDEYIAHNTNCQTRLDDMNNELDKRNKKEMVKELPKNDATLSVQTDVVRDETNNTNNFTKIFHSVKSFICPEKTETPTSQPTKDTLLHSPIVICDGNNELIPLINKNKQHEE